MADLFALPSNADVAVLCTNLRELNGKRPVFADHIDSVFLFPLVHLRFIEMASSTVSEAGEVREDTAPTRSGRDRDEADERPRLPAGAPVAASATDAPAEPESDLDIDEEFLRRVRDV
jgi:hypothetical protein